MTETDVAIVGGGLAGLACAVALSQAGLRVTVLERSDEAGGRARSVTDPATGDRIDLGPHILMWEYHNMRRLLALLGTDAHIAWQGPRFITLVDAPQASTLHVYPLPPPLHLLPDLLRVPQLSLTDLASNTRAVWQALRLDPARRLALDDVDAETWLRALGVRERFIDWYWRTVSMAIMNVPLQACSAGALLGFFRYMAGRGRQQIGLPRMSLGDLFVPSARRWIESRGGHVRVATTATELLFDDERASGVALDGGDAVRARWTVAALPPASLQALLPERMRGRGPFRDLAGFAPSAYISTYLWFAERLTEERFWANVWSPRTHYYDFYDLANVRSGWTRGSLIACNLIHSDRAAHLDDARLVEVAREELAGHLPDAARATLLHATVHRIPMAIHAPHPGSEHLRPEPGTPVRGFFLAGDWLATGLPASMESAVRGGWLAAERILAEAGRPKAWAQPLPRMQGLAALIGGRVPVE